MTTLGKTLLAVAAITVLGTIALSLRGSGETPKPAAQAQLTPEQRGELFRPAPQPVKAAPAIHYEAPQGSSPVLTAEDGEGS